MRILANFQEDHAWVLEPGDMLYLPPRWVGGSGCLLWVWEIEDSWYATFYPVHLIHPTHPPKTPHHHRSVPHDGVSLDGDCMTYSVGFRAPAQRELLTAAATAAQALLEGDGCVRGWVEIH